MAKSVASITTAVALIFAFFILFASFVPMAEAKVCERPSKTWSGPCHKSDDCSKHCKKYDYAMYGKCRKYEGHYACFCYYKC